MMKSLVALSLVLAFLAITECSEESPFSEDDLEFFANLKWDQLPRELQIALKKTVRKGDSSNWCCVNEVPIHSIQRSKNVGTSMKVKSTVKTGYKKCNMWGKKCAVYDVRYTAKMVYHTEYYEIPDKSKCDEVDIRCCAHHINVAQNCFTLVEAKEYEDMLLKFKKGGIIDLDHPAVG